MADKKNTLEETDRQLDLIDIRIVEGSKSSVDEESREIYQLISCPEWCCGFLEKRASPLIDFSFWKLNNTSQ